MNIPSDQFCTSKEVKNLKKALSSWILRISGQFLTVKSWNLFENHKNYFKRQSL